MLFNFNASGGTVFSLLGEKDIHLMAVLCLVHLLKVNTMWEWELGLHLKPSGVILARCFNSCDTAKSTKKNFILLAVLYYSCGRKQGIDLYTCCICHCIWKERDFIKA